MGCGSSQSLGSLQLPWSTDINGYDVQYHNGMPQPNNIGHKTVRMGYPPPYPPRSTKQDIFQIDNYVNIDKNILKVPIELTYKTYKELARGIIDGLETELQRLRALFRWITSLDLATLEQTLPSLPEAGTPCDYLLKIHWRMGNYAHFFAQLARAAEIPCVVVSGINKSSAYQLGAPLNKAAIRAQWNAVHVDGSWRFIDVYWASVVLVGKQSRDWALIDDEGHEVGQNDDEGEILHNVNEFFFLTDPQHLICTHFAEDPFWQLLPEPITEQVFERLVYIRDRFFQLNMKLLPDSYRECILRTQRGQVVIKLGVDTKQASDTQFRYLLYRYRKPGEQTQSVPYERFVIYQKTDTFISFTVNFPVAGRFKIDIFGQNAKQHNTLDLVCSYLVDCNDPQKVEPLPVCPEIGWGPGLDAESKGLVAKTHKDPIINTDDGNVEIRFQMKDPLRVLQSIKSNQLDEWLLSKFAIVRTEGDELVINLRLPTSGEFALEMFADEHGSNEVLPNICNYLIKCINGNLLPTPFPRLHEGKLGKTTLADTLCVYPISHLEDTIHTNEEHLTVSFESKDPDVEILCELQNNTIRGDDLSKCVLKTIDGKVTLFSFGLPKAGEYALNVYARRKGEPNHLHHVHTYLINSTQQNTYNTEKPAHVVPPPLVETSGDDVEINVDHNKDTVMAELTQTNGQNLKCHLTVTGPTDATKIHVKLPVDGKYKLDVFENTAEGSLQHMSTHHIVRDTANKDTTVLSDELSPEEREELQRKRALKEQHKRMRDKLKNAISSQDPDLIHQAIKMFEESQTPEIKNELKSARDVLVYLKLSKELTSAMSNRDLGRLEKAVAAVNDTGLQAKLSLQLAMAKRIIEQLKRIEKLRHAIMKLDQRTIAELKSYATPPPVVHSVMKGTFMLLGERKRDVKDWKSVVVLMGKTGKESLKRRVAEFQVENLLIETALAVKDILGTLQLNEVRDVSSGAAAFHVWTMGMIEECESRFTQKGGDLKEVRIKPN